MKSSWRRKWTIVIIIFLCIFIFAILGNSKTAGGNSASAKDISKDTEADFSVNISYGYSGIAKFGRYMSVDISLYNQGEDFTGWLQVMVPRMQDNAAYRKAVSIGAGDIEEAHFDIPVTDDTGILRLSLVNENNKTIVEDDYPITIDNYQKQVNIGILSDKSEGLYYFDAEGTRVFYLDNYNLADDYMGLDLLDIIVINNYETKKLTPKQISAMEQWVTKGGTLVIGTGEYGDKTLYGWNSFALHNTNTEELTAVSTSFGMNEDRMDELKQRIISYDEERKSLTKMIEERQTSINSAYKQTTNYLYEYTPSDWAQELIDSLRIQSVNKELLDISLDGAVQTVVEKGHSLMQSKALGLGTVQLFNFDLGVDEEQTSFGTAVVFEVLENMSQTKQSQLTDEVYGKYNNYNIYTSMSYTDTENIPRISNYIIIIGIYLFLLSPILYLILKKLDKRNLTWIIVPALAATFTLIIYIAGSGTRIKEPFVGYVKLLEFKEDGDQVQENVFFSLTAPYNHQYNIEIDGQYPVYQLSDSTSLLFNSPYPYRNPMIQEEYNNAIYYGLDQTLLQVRNKPAFSPTYYTSEGSYTMENKLTSNLSYTSDGIKGNVKNHFDFDFTNSMLIIDGNVIDMGQIPRGFSVSAEGKDTEMFAHVDFVDSSSIFNQIAGGTDYVNENNPEVNRKYNVIRYILDAKINENTTSSYFIGFTNDITDIEGNGLTAQLTQGLESYGTNAVIIPIDVNYTQGDAVFVPSIRPYQLNDSGYDTANYQAPVMIDGDVTMEYQLPVGETITALEYLPERNKYVQKDYWSGFEGNIYALNNTTGDFDLLFDSKVKTKIMSLENYLNQQNQITLKYVTKQESRNNPIVMPDLSYWKEVPSNARN
ncbi:MAG: hypothetical protein K0R92_932 [Lachnospiraceae bacterium]|jgi:hypothetical protein|nr:hypothetical protein [Lachnospiraceae bacterium]